MGLAFTMSLRARPPRRAPRGAGRPQHRVECLDVRRRKRYLTRGSALLPYAALMLFLIHCDLKANAYSDKSFHRLKTAMHCHCQCYCCIPYPKAELKQQRSLKFVAGHSPSPGGVLPIRQEIVHISYQTPPCDTQINAKPQESVNCVAGASPSPSGVRPDRLRIPQISFHALPVAWRGSPKQTEKQQGH